MPELPDVEVFRRYVDATALHKCVEHLHLPDPSLLESVSRQKLVGSLVGSTMERTARHGKYLGLQSQGGSWLLLHFGMTGGILARKQERGSPAHTALALDLQNGMRLSYTNPRRLGMIGLASDFAQFVEDEGLGPDALGMEADRFAECLSNHRGSIKSLLMNQEVIAGLGNEYTDEALFHARVRPDRTTDDLSGRETSKLHRQVQRVLKLAIQRHADPDCLPPGWLRRHRKKGARCPRCGGKIEKSRVGGRATYFCPECQR